MISRKSYLRACREYLDLAKAHGWSVEHILRFWEQQGGMWAGIAAELRKGF